MQKEKNPVNTYKNELSGKKHPESKEWYKGCPAFPGKEGGADGEEVC